jgi:hypothetical protein
LDGLNGLVEDAQHQCVVFVALGVKGLERVNNTHTLVVAFLTSKTEQVVLSVLEQDRLRSPDA